MAKIDTRIRVESPADYDAIDLVNREAFGQEAEARLVRAIRRSPDFNPSLSLVAIRRGNIVGHILFSPIHIETDAADIHAIALAPMAVRKKCQRQGIGSMLVLAGLDAHTEVDAQLFAAALRLLLARLRRVEESTGAELLRCIDWLVASKSVELTVIEQHPVAVQLVDVPRAVGNFN